ncbi:MAG: protein-L-isoaspartate(D-aspartate) O-methyltransferase [Bacteroidota bacterium]
MIDSYQHKGLRRKLIDLLRDKGIGDEIMLEAMNQVPRHLFMRSDFESFAYKDQAFPIYCGQTISQPYTVAFQTQLLKIQKGDKVLEIGTGSGYQAAILAQMGAKVYSIERHHDLFLSARKLLMKLNYNIELFYGDGYLGKPAFQPFDKILITAAPEGIPDALLRQLKQGGILVTPVGDFERQVMVRIIKNSENEFIKEEHGGFVFVPMLKGTSK